MRWTRVLPLWLITPKFLFTRRYRNLLVSLLLASSLVIILAFLLDNLLAVSRAANPRRSYPKFTRVISMQTSYTPCFRGAPVECCSIWQMLPVAIYPAGKYKIYKVGDFCIWSRQLLRTTTPNSSAHKCFELFDAFFLSILSGVTVANMHVVLAILLFCRTSYALVANRSPQALTSISFAVPTGYSTKVYNVSAATTTLAYHYSNEELALLWNQIGPISVGPITTTVSPTPEPSSYPRPGRFHPQVYLLLCPFYRDF